ncbi:hypothetical protein MNL13_03285 [Bartonella krasnovii]|uniref:Uncharacterized protein n=1 Tax=Bartonella krasnovii TaxID=2267275 RepID=A0ABY3VWS8_9HYPH|nr:hypothetical protein [Bartonella krasnovii]UNF29794.1 hypothetical protein MNL13_03285 [Bartonella krasnovii]UNF36154.1 hypothetical protein MNL12_03280 [Bartonella krasnovii]UNF49399.1 hypothetical protein MNL04_03585 [Bartonella krasnovii]UNF52757.1 hypothetical protein MNL02_03605 [Bartonella krasnovii]UNF54587.1 hypothetical protein MNL01_04580 [Bartonella krasnovii]
MVRHNKTHEDFPDFGPSIEVIRRIPKEELERSQRESFPDFGPDIEVIRRIPKEELEISSPSPEITQGEAFWNSLKHGLSFNLDDEIAGITAAGRDHEDDYAIPAFVRGLGRYWSGDKKSLEKYDKAVKEIRDYQRRVSDTHYWTSLGGNVLGSIIPSLATLGIGGAARLGILGSKLGQAFSKAGPSRIGAVVNPFLGITNKTTLPHLLKVGAASGALHGAGEGEGLGNTLTSTLAGAGLGAAGTAVGSALGHLAGSTVGGIGRLFSPSHKQGVEKATLRAISKHLGSEASEELGESFKKAVLTDYVADHSPFLQDLVFDIARRNQGAYLDLTKRAEARALGGGERIHQAADKYFIPRQNVTGLKGDLIASREAAAHDLYEIAKKTPIGKHHYGALNELMKRPYFRQAYREGLQEFTSKGIEVGPFSSAKFDLLTEKPNMGVLHETKVKLGIMKDAAEKIGDNSKVHTLVDIQKKLLEIMDAVSSEYKKGRGLYHQYSSHVDAMDEGSKILSKALNKDEFSKIFDELPKGQQEYFKKGSRAELLEGMGQTGDKVSKAKEIFDTDDLYDRFAKIYGSDQAAAVKNVVKREADYADFYNGIPNRIANKDISFTHNVNVPTSKRDAAFQAGKAALKASWIPFKETAFRERQRIEKDVVKLLTGGSDISNKKIVELIQGMVRAQEKGYATKEWVKKLSAALFGGGGKASIEGLNVLSAFE